MRRAIVVGVIAAFVASAVGLASPAAASDCQGFLREPPELGTVRFVDGQIRIDPSALEGDAAALTDAVLYEVTNAADCVFFLIPPQADCVVGNALAIVNDLLAGNLRYVYQDPETGEFVIDYGRLIEDTAGCVV